MKQIRTYNGVDGVEVEIDVQYVCAKSYKIKVSPDQAERMAQAAYNPKPSDEDSTILKHMCKKTMLHGRLVRESVELETYDIR